MMRDQADGAAAVEAKRPTRDPHWLAAKTPLLSVSSGNEVSMLLSVARDAEAHGAPVWLRFRRDLCGVVVGIELGSGVGGEMFVMLRNADGGLTYAELVTYGPGRIVALSDDEEWHLSVEREAAVPARRAE